ncbi:MAG: LacI family DNA-binding transcriptional regulator [Victivallaceae bacterium]|jgi:DNA-binding LacI/PurR family transcriptional regulator
MRSSQNYSLARVSAELGVSKTAVSRVLNGKARESGISSRLQQQILELCDKVNYRPNIHAQRMNCAHVKNIGVLVESMGGVDEHTPFGEYNLPQVLGGIAQACDQAGYRFTMQLYKPEMTEERIFDWFKTREIDGLLYYGFEMPERWLEALVAENRHLVGISINPSFGIPSININNFEASFQLTEHLIAKGRRNFLYLAGVKASYPAEQRLAGFRAALQKAGIPFSEDQVFPADFDYAKTEKFINEYWQRGIKEDAIVCANDCTAVAAISALNSLGCRIPEQIAVAGADNIPVSSFVTPAITTFDNLPSGQGKAAFELLQRIIAGETKPGHVVLKTNLCLRNSA